MYIAELINGEPVVTKDGTVTHIGFNYLSEAWEKADELNEEES